jgi:hypothetical protein
VALTTLACIDPTHNLRAHTPTYAWPSCVFHDVIRRYTEDIPHPDGADAPMARKGSGYIPNKRVPKLAQATRDALIRLPPSLNRGLVTAQRVLPLSYQVGGLRQLRWHRVASSRGRGCAAGTLKHVRFYRRLFPQTF